MDPNQPYVVIEGLDVILKRDIEEHQGHLERSKLEKQKFVEARSHEIKRKRNWRGHIGGGKFDDEALEVALAQMVQNIAMWSDKVKLSDDAIAHHTHIVDTLSAQLEEHNATLAAIVANRDNGRG